MADYTRPQNAERFAFGGLKTNDAADAMPAGKYPYVQNIRAYENEQLTSRPQIEQIIAGPPSFAHPQFWGLAGIWSPGPAAVVQGQQWGLVGYWSLSSPASGSGSVLALEPDLGFYKINHNLYHNGASVDGNYATGQGASIVPYRPDQSVQAWDYVFDAAQSRKATVQGSTVTVENTGIAEPQVAPDAAPANCFQGGFFPSSPTNGGTAGSLTLGTRTSGTIFTVVADPANPTRLTILYSGGTWSKWMAVRIGSPPITAYPIEDVLPAITPIKIQAIYYLSGTTGECIVVPQVVNLSTGIKDSLYQETLLGSLRRGALVKIDSGSFQEVCFVEWAVVGPDGTLCFQTKTVAHHNAGETLSGFNTFVVSNSSNLTIPSLIGAPISADQYSCSVTAGIGTISGTITNPFADPTDGIQSEDYVYFAIYVDHPENIIEIKLIFDVNNGGADYITNTFYYVARQNDLQQGIVNTLTQLGVAQVITQRALIDAETAAETGNQGSTASSSQSGTGATAWAQIGFRVSQLTRTGSDESRSLVNAQAVQVLINCTATVSVAINSFFVPTNGQVDVGTTANPIYYCYRLRSSQTKARSNRSPISRYGVSPRRQQVLLLPNLTGAEDPQGDVLDWYRQGGALEEMTFVGTSQVAVNGGAFTDNYSDDALMEADILEIDNYQPFPSVDSPFIATSTQVVGTAILVHNSANPLMGSYLPGNYVQIGQQVFTLFNRPVHVSGTLWFMQLVENAGYQVNVPINIYEPDVAAQPRAAVWGPDSSGRLFGVQDVLRPGVISWTNANTPDSTRTGANTDLCPPTEPLQNGEMLSETPFVASPTRWWRGYPQPGSAREYAWNEVPVGHGLAAVFGICTDGEQIYFVSKDGIEMHSGGPSESLTDADLYNLFPHEGVFPPAFITYAGQSVYSPNYQYAASFRLAVVNGYLYFDYLDSTGVQRTLVCDLRRKAWSVDSFVGPAITIHAGTNDPAASSGAPLGATLNQQLYMGDTSGAISIEVTPPDPAGEQVSWIVATREIMGDDLRSRKLWGDVAAVLITPNTNTHMSAVLLGSFFGTVGFPLNTGQPQFPTVLSLNGEVFSRALGVYINGTDRGTPTELLWWQPSYIPQPEDIIDRFGDWDEAGAAGAKFFQGFLLEADTGNITKGLIIRDADTMTVQPFDSALGTNVIKHNGQQTKAYTFVHPFVAHLVRYEGASDSVDWRLYGIKWVTQPTPESVLQWIGQPTSFGLPGYMHVRQAMFTYNAPAPLTWTWTVDGVAYNYTIPPTVGYAKFQVPFGPVKGLVWQPSITSTQPFQIWSEDIEVIVGPWGRTSPYITTKLIGGSLGPEVRI